MLALLILPPGASVPTAGRADAAAQSGATSSKKKKKKRTTTRRRSTRRPLKPVPSPARPKRTTRPDDLDDKPLPVTSLPPSPTRDLTPEELSDQRQQLDALREEARKNREQAERIRGRERGVASDLRRLDRDFAITQRYIRQLEARERIVAGQRRLTEMNLQDALMRREAQRRTLAWRLREVYKFGVDRRFETLVSSRSFAELIERTDFFARILDADRDLLQDIHAQTQRIDANRLALVATGQQLEMISSEKQKETRRLTGLRSQKQNTMSSLQTERKSYESRARQMEQAAARIQTLIATLERRRREREAAEKAGTLPPAAEDKWLLSAEFGKNKGNLPRPVQGTIIGKFGRNTNPRYNTVTINNGVDIAAPVGTPVIAVGRGRVEVSESLPGFGRTVILNHGDGYYTIYANCGSVSVSVGAQVEARQAIATVGNVDADRGPYLHFEIRKGKQAQNPEGWFR